jgi:hypothetical protein
MIAPTRALRHRRAALRSLAVGLALTILAGLTSTAAGHGPDPVLGGPLFGQNQALLFDWRSGAAPPAAIKTAIKAAAADASATRASKAATFAYNASGTNPIGYGVGATCGPNGIACFTRSAPNGFTMWLREQGHVFDWGTLKWCQSYATAPNGCFDVETIALDEFGHIESLNHHVNYADERDYEDAVVQTISRAKPETGWNTHRFGTCDIATLQREYDVSSTTAKYSTCLDVSTTLTLAASPTSVAYRDTTTLTATLKVADVATYDRLRNNPVSGRTVTLQRRPRGTTTWITVGSMAVGSSGTYSLVILLLASTEFRAVFKTPTDEGLNGDTSPVVVVPVPDCATPPCPLSAPAASSAAKAATRAAGPAARKEIP